MKILITGGTGFVGQHVAEHYIKAGHTVYVTGREAPVPGTEYLGRDFQQLDFDKLPTFDILNHQAAITDPQHADEDEIWRVNFRDAITLFQQAAGHGVRRIVYASSAAVYGRTPGPYHEDGPFNPLTAYGYSKLALDKLAGDCLPRTIPVIGLRYSNVWGPGEGHKGKLSSQIRQIGLQMIQGKRPKLFKFGMQRRDFVHVDDVARANILAARCVGREVFNIGQGANQSFIDIVNAWNGILQTSLQPDFIDNPFTDTYQAETCLDISSARMIGWKPQAGFYPQLVSYKKNLTAIHGRRGNR